MIFTNRPAISLPVARPGEVARNASPNFIEGIMFTIIALLFCIFGAIPFWSVFIVFMLELIVWK